MGKKINRKEITKWELRLMELRYEGFGYPKIVETLRNEFPDKKSTFTTNYLPKLLCRSQRLAEPYAKYCEEMNKISFQEGQNIIKSAHKVAGATMVGLMAKRYPSAIRLGASKDILDRNAGKAPQKLEIEESIGAKDRNLLEKAVKLLTYGNSEKEKNSGETDM